MQAETYLTKALTGAPQFSLARRLLTTSYLRSGQLDKAVATLQPLLKEADINPAVSALAGETFLQSGDVKKAEEYFAKAARQDPKNPRPRTALALTQLAAGNNAGIGELQAIADLAIEHDLIVLTDEVYEHLTFDGVLHIPMATLPGMRDRVLNISSGGKSFNTTGWKVGWLCGPAPLVAAARTAKQFLTYVSSGPFQPAIALGLGLPDSYYREFGADMQAKRDRLMPGLLSAGFEVYPTQGTYFVTVDIRPLRPDGNGMAFCRDLPHHCGVVAIPNEVFYMNKHEGRHLVRFAFCKKFEVLDEAVARLKTLG